MKTVKQVCALLLAFILVLSIAMQPGIVSVWAQEDPEDGPDTQIEELLALAEESDEEEPAEEEEPEDEIPDDENPDDAESDDEESDDEETDDEETDDEETDEEESGEGYPWDALETDQAFADWLTLADNADVIKGILNGEQDETRDALDQRITEVLTGTDTELAEMVTAYLTELLTESPDTLTRLGITPEETPSEEPEKTNIWEEMTDEEFAAWLMDEENAQTVEKILSNEEDECCKSLYARIDALLDGEDEELAEKVNQYLSKLMGPQLDDTISLAEEGYIYFDLAADSISFNGTSYSGKIYETTAGGTPQEKTVSGTHKAGNRYYIYQSTSENRANTGLVNNEMVLPDYEPVTIGGESWSDYISQYQQPTEVRSNWNSEAPKAGRASTPNRITIQNTSNITLPFVLDNLWSSHQAYTSFDAPGDYPIAINMTQNAKVEFALKGDNRLSNIWAIMDKNLTSQFTITSAAGDKSTSGSLTLTNSINVAGSINNHALLGGGASANGYLSLAINGGTIYAGNPLVDNSNWSSAKVLHCIGGRSNGKIQINGGTVTAISNGTAAAIGGCGGYENAGGEASVTITGGTVKAYNSGVYVGGAFVPCTAIGGSSSAKKIAAKVNVTITGGDIYAQSIGGTAIGGGGSALLHGGDAIITISGGNIEAWSKPGTVAGKTVPAGIAIGGGVGGTNPEQNGGYTDLTITGGTIVSGSVGGGSTNSKNNGNKNGNVGYAKVNISGNPDITAQFVMAAGSNHHCSFTMSGGTIHSVDTVNTTNYVYKNGGALWMDDPNGVVTISGGIIRNCKAVRGGAVYMTSGSFSMTGGTISANTATENGGGIDLHGGTVNLKGGTLSGNTADQNGGGVFIAKGTLNMSGGTVSGNTAQGNGGGIDIHGDEHSANDGIVTISGGEITGNTAEQNGGGVFIYAGRLTMTNGTISNNKATGAGGKDQEDRATGNGGGIDLHAGEVVIGGGRIENNTAYKNGGGIFVYKGTFTLDQTGTVETVISGNRAIGQVNVLHAGDNTGCGGGIDVHGGNAIIKGGMVGGREKAADGHVIGANMAAHNGGGIYIAEGTLTMQSGIVSGNTAEGNGGGIDIHGKDVSAGEAVDVNAGRVVISGGTVDGNTAKQNGGGVFVHDGRFEMTNGTISDNTAIGPNPDGESHATGNGGGIDLHAGEVVISGGRIENNAANKNGGGVFVYEGTFTLSGTAVISGNQATGQVEVLHAGDNTGCGGGIDVHGGNAFIKGGMVGGTEKDAGGSVVGANVAAHNGGGIYIAEGTLTMQSGSVSGNTAHGNGGGIDIHGKDISAGGSVDVNAGKVVISGGTVDGNTAKQNGGGVFVYDGSFQMTGGTISDNTATGPDPDGAGHATGNGGGIDLHAGDVTISGGIVEKNTANKNGGGVFVYAGTFTMSDTAVISENQAIGSVAVKVKGDNTGFGGGIDVHGGTVNLSGGDVEKNIAYLSGGGLFVYNGNVFMTGGIIFQNEARGDRDSIDYQGNHIKTGSGGGIDIHGGNFDMSAGIVEENIAKLNGGGVFVYQGIFTLSKEGAIINNTASQNGGGIDIHDGNVTISGGTVEHNEADQNGGGVYVAEGTLTVTAGTIAKNKAKVNGGGLDVHGSDDKNHPEQGVVEISGGSISENTAENNGGGVFVFNGEFTLKESGTVSRNTAFENGGGIDVHEGNVYIYGGSVETNHAKNGAGIYLFNGDLLLCGEEIGILQNTASENGGGMFIHDGSITMYSGSVDNNMAEHDGGGMYVFPQEAAVKVYLYSGSVSHNTAHGNGGGIALNSTSNKNVEVVVGVNAEHPNLNLKDRTFTPFEYPSSEIHLSEHANHTHKSCPQIVSNSANSKGGGFYLSGNQTTLTFYCIHEEDSIALDERCYGMYMNGGQVNFNVPGNTLVESTILVEGGSMDVYGIMTNPRFTEKVTVDIKTAQDHYYDHRTYGNVPTHYKVHYNENFKGEGDTATGLYIAKQYPDPDKEGTPGQYAVDILPFMFTHPGYKIIGWCTNPEPVSKDPSHPSGSDYWYQVYQTYQLDQLGPSQGMGTTTYPESGTLDPHLLRIYAIWEKCGYVLRFLPNVPEGSSYSGTMADQRVTVGDASQTLTRNAYSRNGYVFSGWTLNPDGSGTLYPDQYAIVQDFTVEDGAIIPLYAKWELCSHIGHLTYAVTDNGLTETCSRCGNHTAQMTLTTVNAAFDEKEHPAFAEYDTNWLGGKPKIVYTMAASDWDTKDTVKADWDNNPDHVPVHAGEYTASVTVGGVTVSKNYTISPVQWATPATPKVQLQAEADGHVKVVITEPTGDHLVYAKSDTNAAPSPESEDWKSIREFSGLTYNSYYYFFAVKEATRDHLRSEVSSSEAYLYTGGNMVIIQSDVGIVATPTPEGEGGYHLTVTPANGYHYYNYTATLTAEELKDSEGNPVAGATGKENVKLVEDPIGPSGEKNYHIEGLNDAQFCVATIHLTGAAKDCTVEAKATDGQVFTDFNEKAVTISRDSAFTASFTVKDLIPAEYASQALDFDQALPAGTTVILKTNGQYWHYKLAAAASTVDLTGFTEMGGNASFAYSAGMTAVDHFTYQFIVDFSQTTECPTGDKLGMSLQLTHKAGTHAPDCPASGQPYLRIGLENPAQFAMTAAAQGKTASLTCTYTPSAGAASIWNGRKTALVLTAQDTTVPSDLTLTAVVGGQTTIHSLNNQKQFIVPLSALSDHEVKLSLHSASFKKEAETLNFEAQWMVSPSDSAEAPMQKFVAAIQNLSFSCKVDSVPSLRIDGTQRVRAAGETIQVQVTSLGIPADGTLTASLQSKSGNSYVDTGARQNVVGNNVANVSFRVGTMPTGSYRILVTVSQNGGNLLQVPYYFLIAAS